MIEIRAFEESDTEEVVALWAACGLLRPWNDPRKDIARKLAVQRDMFLIGRAGDRIVGTVMAGYDGHRGSIYYLAVDPERQGHGLGAQLMAHAEALLLSRGCPKINVSVRAGNAGVISFYQLRGYRLEGDSYAVTMGLRLIPDAPRG